MTEFERMHAGMIYDAMDKELSDMVFNSRQLCLEYNRTNQGESKKRDEILNKLFCVDGYEGFRVLEVPICIDCGKEVKIGKNFYANSYFTVIGGCHVEIGDNVFIGPNCSLATGMHSLIAEERKITIDENGNPHDYEYGKPIKIENDVWIATNVTVCAGVTIGEGSVIGAGSVVTKDIPKGVVAFGNPCKVQRKITKEDSIFLKVRR